ncbi:hypothetical protein D9M68_695900 [compost metagenome]
MVLARLAGRVYHKIVLVYFNIPRQIGPACGIPDERTRTAAITRRVAMQVSAQVAGYTIQLSGIIIIGYLTITPAYGVITHHWFDIIVQIIIFCGIIPAHIERSNSRSHSAVFKLIIVITIAHNFGTGCSVAVYARSEVLRMLPSLHIEIISRICAECFIITKIDAITSGSGEILIIGR